MVKTFSTATRSKAPSQKQRYLFQKMPKPATRLCSVDSYCQVECQCVNGRLLLCSLLPERDFKVVQTTDTALSAARDEFRQNSDYSLHVN